MKECFKCGVSQSLKQFYKHAQMKDGHLNKCKTCTKKDVFEHRQENIEKIRAYDRARGARQTKEYANEYYRKYPNKIKARRMVSYAREVKKLFSEPCEVCGADKVHAHHDDYLKPLNIRWLCPAHHHQWHAKHGEAKNG